MDPAEPSPELELRDYLRFLWRRRGLIALTVLAAVAASLVGSFLQPRSYSATADLTLINQSFDPFTSTTTAVVVNPDRTVQNEIGIIQSKTVRDKVRRAIGAAPSIQVSSQGQTNTIAITASAPEPEQAADIANAYARAYIDLKRDQAIGGIQGAVAQVQEKIDDFQRQINDLDHMVASTPASQRAAVQQDIAPQRAALVAQQTTYQQRIDQMQIGASLQNGGAQITSTATPPGSPSAPKPARSAILAFAVGLILGVAAALVFEYVDDSVRSKNDLERAMGGLPALGLIPLVESWKSHDRAVAVTLDAPTSPVSEAYRALRTSVQFLSVGNSTTVLEVTSPNPGEGKTTSVANLAVSMAQAGQRVCAVGCDLRRPRLHAFLGLPNDVGFTTVLTGESPLSAALQPVPGVEGLHLLSAGVVPPNPAELLVSDRAAEVFRALRARFDVIVVDSPPVLAVTDAAVLAPMADSVLLVANAGTTSRRALSRSVEVLTQVGAPVAGGVLNGATASTGGYDYVRGYGSYRSADVSATS